MLSNNNKKKNYFNLDNGFGNNCSTKKSVTYENPTEERIQNSYSKIVEN